MSKDLEFLKAHNINVYGLLEIPKDASSGAIRKAYRKLALVYHPDKNSSHEAAQVFHSITLSLNVLSDIELRRQYDSWISSKEAEIAKTQKLDDVRKQMKADLEKAESDSFNRSHTGSWAHRKATKSSNTFGFEIERLREEGARKRRAFEAEYLSKFETKSEKRLPVQNDSNRTVKVRWKFKEEISKLFTEFVLEGILTMFGPVEKVTMLKKPSNEKRYDSALVVFKTHASAYRATSHDFSKKSNIWDKTSFKKLSGLLREVKWVTLTPAKFDSKQLDFEDYKYLTLKKLQAFDPLSS